MKTILITGGAGFIGSNFVQYLFNHHSDYRIIVLDALTYAGNMDNIPQNIRNDSRFTFWYGNICNGNLVDELISQSDVVVHFAAESHVARSIFDNFVFFETDVIGTYVIANSVLRHKDSVERFIHISTSEVYGTSIFSPMTEDHPLNPASPYAAAKVGADRLVYSYCETYDIPAIIIRPFNQYGPNQHLEKAIPRFITSALLNEPLTVHGSGDNTRDWVYVMDLCSAIDKTMHVDLKKVKGQVINIGTGIDLSVLAIANLIVKDIGKSTPITNIGDRPGQVQRHISSTDKALSLLGWKSQTGIEEGLSQTVDWYKNNKEWWSRLRWMRHVLIKTKDGRVEYH